MHVIDQHPFYPSTEEDRLLIRRELGFKESILQEDIDAIIEWFLKQPHLAHAPIGKFFLEVAIKYYEYLLQADFFLNKVNIWSNNCQDRFFSFRDYRLKN